MGKRTQARARIFGTTSGATQELLMSIDDLTSGDWTPIGSTVLGGQTDPDGGSTAYLLTSTGTGRLRQVLSALVIGRQYRFQASIKAVGVDISLVNIYLQDNGSPFSSTSIYSSGLTLAEGFIDIDTTITLGGSLTSKRFEIDIGNLDALVISKLSLKEV